MTILDDAQKRFIVRRLACFASQVAVIAEFEAEYKIKLTADHVSSYDATTKHGRERMGQDLQDYFHETRDEYIKNEDSIPLATRAFRIRWLTEMLLTNPKVQRSAALQMSVIEQAAKEMGGMYVRHKVEDKGSGLNALMELRSWLEVPLTAPEAGPIEAAQREQRRQEERAREEEAAAEEEGRLKAEQAEAENGDAESESA